MKKILLVLMALGIALLGCGCDLYSPNVESLLSAPLLSDLQNRVDEALRDVVGQDLRLFYPLSGRYRSPYVFHDLDGDGEEEAVVLYSLEEGSETISYIQILRREDGRWRAGEALPVEGDEVEFVRFASLCSGRPLFILVGLRREDSDMRRLSVFSCRDGCPVGELSLPYSQVVVGDFSGDGRDQILAAATKGGITEFVLAGEDESGGLSPLDSIASEHRVLYLLDPVAGMVRPGVPGVVFDGMSSPDTMISLLVEVAENHLVLPQNTTLSPRTPDLLSGTARANGVRTSDVNGDGVLDIPFSVPAPGYAGPVPEDVLPQYFTEYRSFGGERLEKQAVAYVDPAGGYSFLLPDRWLDLYESRQLSVIRRPNRRSVAFFLYRGSLADRGDELLQFSVIPSRNAEQENPPPGSFSVGERGRFRYYATLSPSGERSGLTPRIITSAFRILS